MAYPYYQQYYQQPMHQQLQSQNNFMSVPNEEIVNNYPVAPGNCVTFKIEGKPLIIEKSMGFSQFESPKIERYKIIKEEPPVTPSEPRSNESINSIAYAKKDDLEILKDEIDRLKKEIDSLKEGA